MTPNAGSYNINLQNLFRFSNCSINSMKTKLLSTARTYIYLSFFLQKTTSDPLFFLTEISFSNASTSGQCLVNLPMDTITSYFNTSYLPGTLWSLDDQCKFLFGSNSSYQQCSVNFININFYQNVFKLFLLYLKDTR
jgi:hypothetical protein